MKNAEHAGVLLKGILRSLNQLPMRRSTDWIMELIRDRVELNLDADENHDLIIKLAGKNIADLERIPEERKQTDFNISLLRDKFEAIIRLLSNPNDEYQNGGDSDKSQGDKTENPRMVDQQPQRDNGK